MHPADIQERKRAAQRRLRAQRNRAGELRGRVVAIALISFALLWGVVFVQMATGNDPVLSKYSSAKATAGSGKHRHRAPAGPEVETGASTDSEPVTGSEEITVEPVESSETEEFVEEPVEVEAAEGEFVEEPEPVVTSQS